MNEQEAAQETPQYDSQDESQQTESHNGKPSLRSRFTSFVLECKRVLSVTKKPNREEFMTIVKVSGIGILAIGFIGFIIHLVRELLF